MRVNRHVIVTGVFILIALFGVGLSLSTPYFPNDDEHVHFLANLQEKEQNLPDAYMLQGLDHGPYIWPKVLDTFYEPLGHDVFKSIALVILIFTTGLAAYFAFRYLGLPWIPSLALSVIALLPRYSIGLETFGLITFREAIGRSFATPIFFIATAFLINRVNKQESLWPIFGIIGFLLFIHPVSITLFALLSLVATGVTMLLQRRNILKTIYALTTSFAAFILAGSYFFVEVVLRLGRSIPESTVSILEYTEAVVFRNAWEFPLASVAWIPHMLIVSIFFIGILAAVYFAPQLRFLRERYQLPRGKDIAIWGATLSIAAIVLSLVVPAVDLFFMKTAGMSHIFQQWNRIAKFYYLGIFILLIPATHMLWQWFTVSSFRFKKVIAVLLIAGGIASSSFAFEWFQFTVGYPNYTAAYIPQALSKIEDGMTPEEYSLLCKTLSELGAGVDSEIISGDFRLRFYCRANLYVTYEEGSAYMFLKRSDLVEWHRAYLAQRAAFKNDDPYAPVEFAKSVGARFIVDGRREKYTLLKDSPGLTVATTTQYIIIKVNQ